MGVSLGLEANRVISWKNEKGKVPLILKLRFTFAFWEFILPDFPKC